MEENENVEEVQGTESTEEQVVEQESPVSYKDDGTIEEMKKMTDTVIRRVYNEPKIYKESNKKKK